MTRPDLEIDLLRAFVAVAETGSFTAATEVVHRSQSAVSQKILRLEQLLNCKLFDRSGRSVGLTKEGEQLLTMARRMLEINDSAVRSLTKPQAKGSLRLGVSEDFIPSQLPTLLSRFRRVYPEVKLELMTGLSCNLLSAYRDSKLDAVIAKKDGSAQAGRVIWREPLVWLAAKGELPDPSKPLPLVLLPPPCTYRDIMTRSLDAARREWVPSCIAGGLMGVQAAVAGGMGVSVLGRSFVQPNLQVLSPSEEWPALPMTEIVVLGEDQGPRELIDPLVSFLMEGLSPRLEASQLVFA